MQHRRTHSSTMSALPQLMLNAIAIALAGCGALAHQPVAVRSEWSLIGGNACAPADAGCDRRQATRLPSGPQHDALSRDAPQMYDLPRPCRSVRLLPPAPDKADATPGGRTGTGPFPDDFGAAGFYAAAHCISTYASTLGDPR